MLAKSGKKNAPVDAKTSEFRRRFLQLGLGAGAMLLTPHAFATAFKQTERTIALLNLHTGEQVKATYWAEGAYQPDELQAISRVLRDHRTGDIHDIDNDLIEILNLLHHKMEGKQPFHVISGYRSPKTNQKLRQSSHGVAKKSLHMQGKAIDIRLPGSRISALRQTALEMKVGGVGYYPRSDFIHIDTGRVRSWQG